MRTFTWLVLCLGLLTVRSATGMEMEMAPPLAPPVAPMPQDSGAAAVPVDGPVDGAIVERAPANPEGDGDRESASNGDAGLGDTLCRCRDCRPGCFFAIDALFLARPTHVQFQPLVVDSDPPNPSRMTTSDLQFNTAPGMQLTLGLSVCEDAAWEIGYFGVQHASASATVEDRVNNNLSLPGNMGLQFPSDFARAAKIRADYDSTLHNGELNYVRTYDCFAFLAGVRYLELDEDFNLNSENTITGTSDYHVRTTNRLYGAQIGGRVAGGCGQIEYTITGKAGIYGNNARQSNHIDDLNNTFLVRDTLAHGGTAAMVGDLNFLATYRLSTHWAVRGGYNLLWIEGLALAPDQLDFNTDANAGTAINNHAGLFLHGANVGVEARW